MRIVFRADDIGYSEFSNRGAFKAIDEGVVTHAEIMSDTPGAVDAMEFMRERPWISVGWHAHFWGNPVAGAQRVPSLVGTNGRFKTDPATHRPDMEGWNIDELIEECRAQVEKFIRYMGRVPDTADLGPGLIGKIKKQVCDEYGVVCNHISYWHYGPGTIPGHMEGPNCNPNLDHRFAGRKIYEYENFGRPGLILEDYLKYDPLDMIKTMPESENIWVRSSHPGWVCDYIWKDTWDNCSITRCQDAEVLYSDELKEWLQENHVELINLRDALYGSCEYQNHLKATGSELYAGK
ncbi:MAG: ChbG/HpnK family deacetylase [Lachnospiraceae bacterium]|nr:ChbG/HpnK family deacetylase [Lachnospiraceae bacterium]